MDDNEIDRVVARIMKHPGLDDGKDEAGRTTEETALRNVRARLATVTLLGEDYQPAEKLDATMRTVAKDFDDVGFDRTMQETIKAMGVRKILLFLAHAELMACEDEALGRATSGGLVD